MSRPGLQANAGAEPHSRDLMGPRGVDISAKWYTWFHQPLTLLLLNRVNAVPHVRIS